MTPVRDTEVAMKILGSQYPKLVSRLPETEVKDVIEGVGNKESILWIIGEGNLMVTTYAKGALYVNLVCSDEPMKWHWHKLKDFARLLGVKTIRCTPSTSAHARLYRRFGFERDKSEMIFYE